MEPVTDDHLRIKEAGKSTKVDWSKTTCRIDKTMTESDRVDIYNNNSAIYDGEMQALGYGGPKMAASKIHQYLQGNHEAKILDVGGGTGKVIEELRVFGAYHNTDGLDPSKEMLKLGQERGLYNKVYPEYFRIGTGVEHNSYDVIVCCGAIIPGHIKAETVKEMLAIIRPGGFIVLEIRNTFVDSDEDIKSLRPLIQTLAQQSEVKVVEDNTYPAFFAGIDGRNIVLQKP